MEKRLRYTTRIKQPQVVAGVKLNPKGGIITEREYKTLSKDAYGASLLEKRFIIFEEKIDMEKQTASIGESIPDFNSEENKKK